MYVLLSVKLLEKSHSLFDLWIHYIHMMLKIIYYIYILHIYIYIFFFFSEKAMAPHTSTLAWKIPWMEEPGGLQSMGSLRVGHD